LELLRLACKPVHFAVSEKSQEANKDRAMSKINRSPLLSPRFDAKRLSQAEQENWRDLETQKSAAWEKEKAANRLLREETIKSVAFAGAAVADVAVSVVTAGVPAAASAVVLATTGALAAHAAKKAKEERDVSRRQVESLEDSQQDWLTRNLGPDHPKLPKLDRARYCCRLSDPDPRSRPPSHCSLG
jgi:hypothetical protein